MLSPEKLGDRVLNVEGVAAPGWLLTGAKASLQLGPCWAPELADVDHALPCLDDMGKLTEVMSPASQVERRIEVGVELLPVVHWQGGTN